MMKRFLRSLVFAILGIGVLVLTDTVVGAKNTELQPFYLCHGKNAHGATYETALETRVEDGQVQLRWTSANGAILLGVGFLEGHRLAVGLLLRQKTFGAASYEVKGQTLVGSMMLAGLADVTPETCKAADPSQFKVTPPPLPPEHTHVDAGHTLEV